MDFIPQIIFPPMSDSQIWSIVIALIMILADIMAGFITACINSNVQSSKMREGLWHKSFLLIIIMISYILGVGMDHISAFKLDIPTVEIVCGYIVVMELASVLENVQKGWPEFGESTLFKILYKTSEVNNFEERK